MSEKKVEIFLYLFVLVILYNIVFFDCEIIGDLWWF